MIFLRILAYLVFFVSLASPVGGQSVSDCKDDPTILLAAFNALSAIKSGDVLTQHDELLDGVEDSIIRGTPVEGVVLERKNSTRLIFDLDERAFARFSVRSTSATEISSQNLSESRSVDDKVFEWDALVFDNRSRRLILIDCGRRTVLNDITPDVAQNSWRGFGDPRMLWKYGDQLTMHHWDGFEQHIKSLCGRQCKACIDNGDSILTFRSPYGGVIVGMDENISMVEEIRVDMQSMMPHQYEMRFENGSQIGSYRTVTTKWGTVESHHVPIAVSSRSREGAVYKGSDISGTLVSSWKLHWFSVNGKEASQDTEQLSSRAMIERLLESPEKINQEFVLKMVDPVQNRANSLIDQDSKKPESSSNPRKN